MTATTSLTTWLYWRERLERVLTTEQLAIYDAYVERLAHTPTLPTLAEQDVLYMVAADRRAAAQELEAERLAPRTRRHPSDDRRRLNNE